MVSPKECLRHKPSRIRGKARKNINRICPNNAGQQVTDLPLQFLNYEIGLSLSSDLRHPDPEVSGHDSSPVRQTDGE